VRSASNVNTTQNEEDSERDRSAQERSNSADSHGDCDRGSSPASVDDWNAEILGPPWDVLAPVVDQVRTLETISGRPSASSDAEVQQICEALHLQAEQRDAEPALVERMRSISSKVEELRDKHRDDQNEPMRLLAYLRNILLFLIPQYVRLLLSVIERYTLLDSSSQATSVNVNLDRVLFLRSLCADIVALGEDLDEKKKHRRFSNAYKDHIEPTRRNIIVPIRSLIETFLLAIKDTRGREEQERRTRLIREEEARRRQSEALQEEYHRARKRKVTEWRRLHEQRRYAERGFLSFAKQLLLAYVEPVDQELDSDGLPFERVDVFAPLRVRVGPSPEQMQSARAKSWSFQQEQDLMAGLKEYAGDDVLFRIFTRYCGNSLTAFNVSDIVTRAADLKERCLLEHQESQQTAPAWVQQIPVWTRPHAIGKENEEHTEHHNGTLLN
jgi:hypothetical protein